MAESAGELGGEGPFATTPSIEFFILADRAEAVNGKLYMMGGGWDRYFVQSFAQPVPISFALGILVPWNATNRQHGLQITIEDADGHPLRDFRLEASFVAGRPAHIVTGETQRVILTVPTVAIKFEGPGAYQAVARVSNEAERRVSFFLVPAASPPPPQFPASPR
jgi:hypothetical protein